MSELDPTQSLPTEQEPPAPTPPVQKPTLASLIVSRMDWIATETGNMSENTDMLYVKVSHLIAQVKTLLLVAIACLLFLSVAILACVVFEAILVGHVR